MKQALKVIAIVLSIGVSTAGCESDAEKREKIAVNKKLDEESAARPEYIGQVNGQNIHRITVHNTPDGFKHFVYFTEDVQTANKRTSHGKGTRPSVYVTIGDKQVPLAEVKQVVADAEAELSAPK